MGSSTSEPRLEHSSSGLAPGTMVGDYRIDHTIGSGGMGAVYQATQPVIGKRVAIKVLHRSKSQSAVNRFVKEARAVNLIEHPNIVDVFGFGMTDDGRAYLVMELLIGETLAVRAKRGPMSLAEICDVLIAVTHALEAAHEANVIHRDLKPENIFLTRRRGVMTVKLLDFGIAKLLGDEPGMSDETRPGILIGTPRYISPEQVSAKPLDGGADIYTLGVVAFELMAGRTPFVGNDSFELFEKHAKLKPPKLSAFNTDLPPSADALVAAMLAKEPSERPSLAAIRHALEALRTTPAASVAAAPSPRVLQPTDVHAVEPITETRTVLDPNMIDTTRRRRLALPAMLVGASVAGVLVAMVLVRGHTADERVAPLPDVAVHSPAPAVTSDVTTPATPTTPPAAPPTAARTVVPTIARTSAPPSGSATRSANAEPSDSPEIELDPIAAGTSHAGVLRHANAPHVRHDHPHAPVDVKPDSEPTKAGEKPAVPSPAPTPPNDDDAVRSPFEHKP